MLVTVEFRDLGRLCVLLHSCVNGRKTGKLQVPYRILVNQYAIYPEQPVSGTC